uniref:Uncharacterized protein n=1 Tax=Pristionchus pacificus TaxID=54126 RepID=A0A2A6BXM8_PRIPA|eukprot:PDM70616.1 hypothetical protein PRIPAC_46862 [Pristionchus pacificus]
MFVPSSVTSKSSIRFPGLELFTLGRWMGVPEEEEETRGRVGRGGHEWRTQRWRYPRTCNGLVGAGKECDGTYICSYEASEWPWSMMEQTLGVRTMNLSFQWITVASMEMADSLLEWSSIEEKMQMKIKKRQNEEFVSLFRMLYRMIDDLALTNHYSKGVMVKHE